MIFTFITNKLYWRFVIQADCCGIEDLGVSLDTGNHQLVIYGTKISNDRRRYVDRIRAPDADSILFGESYIKNPYDKVKRVILNERKVGRFRRIIQLPSSDLLSSNNVHIHHNKTLGIAEIDVMKTHDDTEEEYHSDIIIEASSWTCIM